MNADRFPVLDPVAFRATRDALHAYARILGKWTESLRPPRKHWLHASLRPSLTGMTTRVIHGDTDVEIELNLRDSRFIARTSAGVLRELPLQGQPAAEVAAELRSIPGWAAVAEKSSDSDESDRSSDAAFDGYSAAQARRLWQALSSVAGSMRRFRAGIREETSAVQLWPHHFDLAMLWFPGGKVAGQDPADPEHADRQMNFGFLFGDDGIEEPYFYVTAYPLPDELPHVELPAGTRWVSDGFSGAVLLYRTLVATRDPAACLQDLWTTLLRAGQRYLADEEGH